MNRSLISGRSWRIVLNAMRNKPINIGPASMPTLAKLSPQASSVATDINSQFCE